MENIDIKGYFSGDTNKTLAEVSTLGNDITGIMVIFGYAAAVIMLLYIAIRYIIAKPAEKAHLKIQLSYLAVGVIILISVTSILNFVSGIFTGVFKQ